MRKLLLTGVFLMGFASLTHAQDYPTPTDVEASPIRYPGLNQGDTTPGTPRLPHELELTVAAGVAYQPDYMGSDDSDLIFAPAFDLEYKQRIFVVHDREAMMVPYEGLGVKLLADQNYSVGVNLTYDAGRDDDNGFINGIGDMDWTALGGVFGVFHPGPFFVRGQVGYDLLDEFDGYKGEIGTGITAPINPYLRGMIELSTAFSGDGYAENYFGISTTQSAASGLPVYNPDGGFYRWSLGGVLQHQLTQGAFVQGMLRYDQLINDAADSPITQDDGTFTLKGLVGYKF